MDNIRAVIFDLDNTLADRKYAYMKHSERMADMFLTDPSLKDIFVSRLICLDNNGYARKNEVYAKIYSEFPLSGSPEEMSSHWNESAREFICKEPYAEEILTYLSGKYTLALLTNGYTATQKIKLERVGLEKYFSAVMISEETGTEKPDREIYLMMCRRIGIPPEECVYVGDNYENDAAGPLSAGMNAVLYDRFHLSEHNYPMTIHSLAELKKIL